MNKLTDILSLLWIESPNNIPNLHYVKFWRPCVIVSYLNVSFYRWYFWETEKLLILTGIYDPCVVVNNDCYIGVRNIMQTSTLLFCYCMDNLFSIWQNLVLLIALHINKSVENQVRRYVGTLFSPKVDYKEGW